MVFFKIETPKNIWIDEFVCLRSKMYAYKCGDDSQNKLKGVSKSQSKHIKFEEYYNYLFGGEHQNECDNYIIRSIYHEMYLQRVKSVHYLNLEINDVIYIKLKVYLGINNILYMLSFQKVVEEDVDKAME